MTARLKSLERIASVQKQMVRLSEWRLASAERTHRELSEDQMRLQSYVVEEGALGVSLAKSALRSLRRFDERLAEAARARETSRAALAVAKRRESAMDQATEAARRADRRKSEDRELAATVETWLAAERDAEDASLP